MSDIPDYEEVQLDPGPVREAPSPPPTRPSALTPEHKKRVSDWYRKKAEKHDPKCPVCGTGNWYIFDDFITPSLYGPAAGMLLGGVSYPHFMLGCANCGNVQFINAVLAGVIPKVDDSK